MTGIVLTTYSGAILGPIAKILGWIMNLIYEGVSNLFGIESVALSILIITVVIYTALLPFTIKQQKFAKLQQKMQPEIQKIQELFCYPMNETIRYFTYITYILFYCAFLIMIICIFHFKINKTLNEEAAKEEKRNQDTTDLSIDESVIKANISLLKCSIISYSLIQCVKFFNCVIFLMNFMCGKNHILFLWFYSLRIFHILILKS